jgi:hypothetical protein
LYSAFVLFYLRCSRVWCTGPRNLLLFCCCYILRTFILFSKGILPSSLIFLLNISSSFSCSSATGHRHAMATTLHKPLGAITVDDLAAAAPGSDATALHAALRRALDSHGPTEVWGELCRSVLCPSVPFAVHRMLYYGCFAGFPSPTPPAWTPDP